jgi:hypothetical protein
MQMTEFDFRDYGVYTVEELIEDIRRRLCGYYDFPETVFSSDHAYIVFNAEDLDWLCENSAEPEFWRYLRGKSKYGIDFQGGYYTVQISELSLKE